MRHDLVIRSGTVIDGSGQPARTANIAIDGDRIVEVWIVDGAGFREIDANGALVVPGFVDIHTHYDGQATWDARLRPSSNHGVTTVVAGNCGVGFAPVDAGGRDVLLHAVQLGGTGDRNDPRLLREEPGERDLRRRRVLGGRDALEQLDEATVRLGALRR